MALLGSKKPTSEEVLAATATSPSAPTLGAKVSPPKPIAVRMGVDGGLNGRVWRVGEVVDLDPDAADFYLAKGFGVRV